MGKSQHLRHADVQAMLDVMGELLAAPDDPAARTGLLVERIGQLCRARAAWTTRWRTDDGPRGKVQPYAIIANGFTPAELAGAVAVAAIDPLHGFVIEDLYAGRRVETAAHVFETREIDASRRRARADAADQLTAATGGDFDVVVNCPGAADGHFASLGLARGRGDRPFAARERSIAAMLWSQSAALHRRPLSIEPSLWGARLAPRLDRVLHDVLGGFSAKQIARRAGLSVHTVNEYIKQLYRRFGVSGRAELMAAFVQRPAAT